MKCARKTIFTFSFPVTLTSDLWTSTLVTLVQRCDSTKLEVSTAFLFQENRRHVTEGHGQTDGRTDGRTDGGNT